MRKRLRKKRLIKKYSGCKYPVKPNETWSLYLNIAEYVLPRLRLFKRLTNGYPGRDEANTPEKWYEILDKMILAFEYIIDENWWLDNPKYDYTDGLHILFGAIDEETGCGKIDITEEDWVAKIKKNHDEEWQRRKDVINDGLNLFTKWYLDLGW